MNKFLSELIAITNLIKFNNLSSNQRKITIYSEGKNYWPHLEGLLNVILKFTNKTVCYVSSSRDDPGLLIKHENLTCFFIAESFVRDYFFQNLDTDIMIMTMPDLQNYQIKRSINKVHYIYVQHSLVSLHAVYRHGAFDHYDTICAAGPHHVREIRAIEKKYNLPKKNIFKLGYSRIDNLLKKKYLSLVGSSKKVLIAPSWGPDSIIESGLYHKLINEFLSLEYKIILRPHPQTIKFNKKEIAYISKKYRNNPLFSMEKDLTGDRSFYESDIMVSDWSGAAIEFAIALQKPVIFCDVPRKINNTNYQDIIEEPIEVSIRKLIGVIWDGKVSINDIVSLCMKKKILFKQLNEKFCFNLGDSDRQFIKLLDEIYSKM